MALTQDPYWDAYPEGCLPDGAIYSVDFEEEEDGAEIVQKVVEIMSNPNYRLYSQVDVSADEFVWRPCYEPGFQYAWVPIDEEGLP